MLRAWFLKRELLFHRCSQNELPKGKVRDQYIEHSDLQLQLDKESMRG